MVGWLVRVHNFTGRNESVFGALWDVVAGWLNGFSRWIGNGLEPRRPWLCSLTLDALGDKRSQKDLGEVAF